MSDFLLLVLEDEAAHASRSARDVARLIEDRARYVDRLRGGALRDHGRLRPSSEGRRVRRGGVESGPFADSRALSGYVWIEAARIEEAIVLAEGYPALDADEIDVRPVMKGVAVPDKDRRPGKIFAFAVLGTAANEEAWAQVMDRIDADTRDAFPVGAASGGNRLFAPTTGRHVATRAERRAAFDGPFLESKEMIGGVFFLRMMDIEEASRWALSSAFVAHGTLEIRELWRS